MFRHVLSKFPISRVCSARSWTNPKPPIMRLRNTKVRFPKDCWEVGVTVPKLFSKNELKSVVFCWKSNFFGEIINLMQRLMIKSWMTYSAHNGPIFAQFRYSDANFPSIFQKAYFNLTGSFLPLCSYGHFNIVASATKNRYATFHSLCPIISFVVL